MFVDYTNVSFAFGYIYTDSKVAGAKVKRQAWTATVTDAFFEGLYQVCPRLALVTMHYR